MTEARKQAQNAVMPRLQLAEIAQPADGALDFPAPPVAPQLPAIVKLQSPLPKPIRHNQVDTTPAPGFPQRVTAIRLYPPRCAAAASVADPAAVAEPVPVAQRGLGQGHFVRRGRRQKTPSGIPLPSANTMHFVPLPRFVLPTAEPPAGKKVASIKHFSQRNSPRWSNVANKAHQASNHTPRSSHCRSRRSRSLETAIAGVDRAIGLLFSKPTGCLQHKLDRLLQAGPAGVSSFLRQ